MFGVSGVFFGNNVAGAGVTGANDGVSLTGTIVKLGNTVGGSGAGLTEDREIPDNGFTLWIGDEGVGTNVIGLSATQGIDVVNTLGQVIQALMFGTNFTAFALSGDIFQIVWGTGANATAITFKNSTGRVTITGTMVATQGLGASIRTPVSQPILTFVPATSGATGDCTIIVDTSGGNCVVNIDPTKIANQFGWIKKKGNDVNTITLTATSGLIFGGGTSAATFVFSDGGESIQFQSDGTNLYIL